MAKTRLKDLNEHLFAQLERLNNDDMSDETLRKETSRTEAITKVAREIISSGHLMLKARQLADDSPMGVRSLPDMMLEEGERRF